MAEVKITISAEDRASEVLKRIESVTISAFKGGRDAAASANDMFGSAFDKLKISSNAALEAEKKVVQSAVEIIKTLSDAPAEVSRAIAAGNAQIAAIDTQLKGTGDAAETMAGRTTSALDRCKTSFTDLYFKVKVFADLLRTGLDFAKLGAGALQAEASFRNVAHAYGESSVQLLQKMKQVSAGIIDESNLMQRAVKAMQQGLSGEQIVRLLEVARSSARVAGTDIASAFDGITNAVANQTTRALKLYGIIVDQNKAFEEHAKTLGVSKNALTEMEQAQALANAAIEEGSRQMQAMGPITKNATEKIQEAEAAWHELKETLGQSVLMAMQAVGGLAYMVTGGFLTLSAGIWKTIQGLATLSSMMTSGAVSEGFKQIAELAKESSAKAWEMSGDIASKGMKLWEGVTARVGDASEATKGFAKAAQQAASADLVNTENIRQQEEMNKALDEFTAKIGGINPALNETEKELLQLTNDFIKLRMEFEKKGWDTSKLQEGMLKGAEAVYRKQYEAQKSAFEDMMTDILIARKTGIARDLAEIDKWQEEVSKKFQDNAAMLAAIQFEADKKRITAVAEGEKKTYEAQMEYLTQWRETLVNVYNTGIQKAREYYNQATSIGRTLAQETARWNKLFGKPLLPKDQMEQDARALEQLFDAARNPEDFQKSADAMGNFLEKWQGMSKSLGSWSVYEKIKGLQQEVLSRLETEQSRTQAMGAMWQNYAAGAMQAINNVDVTLYNLEVRIWEIDQRLAEVRELDISTEQADRQLKDILRQLESLTGRQWNIQVNVNSGPMGTSGGTGLMDMQTATEDVEQTIYYYGEGSDRKPIMEKLAEIASGSAAATVDRDVNVAFRSDGGPIMDRIFEIRKRMAEIAGIIAWNRSVGGQLASQSTLAYEAENQALLQELLSYGTFHKGTHYVPKTGPYILEEGEAVIPKELNDRYQNRNLRPSGWRRRDEEDEEEEEEEEKPKKRRKASFDPNARHKAAPINFSPTITINGSSKDPRQLAREIDAEMAAMYRDGRSRLQREMGAKP